MLKIYGFKKVNAMARTNTRDLRVLWALEEMKLPFELMGQDHPAGDLSTKKYHALNPLEQIPAMDDDGLVLTESGAILNYLAKKSGKLIGKGPADEAQVLRWSFVALNSLEVPLMNILMMDWMKDKSAYRDFLAGWAHRHLGNLEGWLNGREFIATDSFTVADILMANVLFVMKDSTLLEPYKNVKAYRDRCLTRPAWTKTMAAYLEYVEPG